MSAAAPPKALPAMDVASRVVRLREMGADVGVDVLLVSSRTNVRYLTGFTGSAGVLVVDADRATLVTDGRYATQAEAELAAAGVAAGVEVGLSADAQRAAVVTCTAGHGRIGLEADAITWADHERFSTTWFPDAELVATHGLVERLRARKDAGEIARIEAAAGIADAALAQVEPILVPGFTEAEVALALDTTMRRLGATGPSFETIVASGPNGARPHARPTDRKLRDGDLLVIDFGACVDGYRSDMTRTVWIGDLDDRCHEIYEVVKLAQAEGVGAVKAGAEAKAVDEACRSVIRDLGWGDAFAHGTGHGVGLEIHEAPSVAATSTATLDDGHVVTVEPGIYVPELGGVRIEDTVVVTPDGCDVLTRAPKA